MRTLTALLGLCFTSSAFAADGMIDIYQQAVKNDTQISAAGYNKKAAEEAVPLAESALLPKVGVFANAQSTRFDNKISNSEFDYETKNAGVQVVQPVYHHNDWVALDQAEKQVEVAGLDFARAEQGLIVRTARAYFDVLRAQDTLDAANANKRAVSKQYNQTKQQFDVGAIAITDVHEARASLDRAATEIIAAKNGVENAKEALGLITGQPNHNLRRLKSKLPLNMPSPNSVDAWVDLAAQNSFNLKTAKLNTEISHLEIDRVGANVYPELDLKAQYVIEDGEALSANGINPSEYDNGTLSLDLNWNIYTGGAVSAQKRRATYQAMAAKTQLDESDRLLKTQIRTAFRNVKAAISQTKATKQALSSAQTALRATRSSYEAGANTIVDVLIAQRRVFEAKTTYQNARYDYLLAHLSLKQAASVLTADDLRLVEQHLQ